MRVWIASCLVRVLRAFWVPIRFKGFRPEGCKIPPWLDEVEYVLVDIEGPR